MIQGRLCQTTKQVVSQGRSIISQFRVFPKIGVPSASAMIEAAVKTQIYAPPHFLILISLCPHLAGMAPAISKMKIKLPNWATSSS